MRARQFRHLRLLLWTLLALVPIALLAGATWWWFFRPTVYFAAVPAIDYGVLAVPPLPFAAEDVDAMAALSRPGQPPLLAGLQTSQGIATLAARLHDLRAKEKDTLILYFRAYGVSDDGKPWLLWSDYLRSPAGGRCSLAEFLGQIAQCRAGKKLVLLDAGDLAYDPRLGVFVNEFPLLLDAEVRRVNDPGLWILASHRPLEVSHVSESERRSAFGYFVSEGLAGAADRDGDGMINLAELVGFVRNGVARWVSHRPAASRLKLLVAPRWRGRGPRAGRLGPLARSRCFTTFTTSERFGILAPACPPSGRPLGRGLAAS